MNNSGPKLKIAGMVAAIVVVVGITAMIATSKLPGSGVSADIADVASGAVVVISQDTYNDILSELENYFEEGDDQTAQDNIIQDVVNTLEAVLK